MEGFVDAESDGGVIRRGEIGEWVGQRFRAVGQSRRTQHLLHLALKHKDCFLIYRVLYFKDFVLKGIAFKGLS